MATLPNGDRALVPLATLTEYALNASHRKGGHKARVFRAALGLGPDDADWLRERILDAVHTEEATEAEPTEHGARYVVDFPPSTDVGTAIVRTAWIVRHGEAVPRLTSCSIR